MGLFVIINLNQTIDHARSLSSRRWQHLFCLLACAVLLCWFLFAILNGPNRVTALIPIGAIPRSPRQDRIIALTCVIRVGMEMESLPPRFKARNETTELMASWNQENQDYGGLWWTVSTGGDTTSVVLSRRPCQRTTTW